MLPEGKHVRTAYGELADNLAPSTTKTFIDSSTIDLKTTLETAKLLERSNIGTFVDAPVSGGTIGAKNGTLTFMVGSKDLSSLKPVLEKMGSRIVSCGGLGSGISAKLANNYLLALSNIATSEAFQLAKNLGLDLKVFSGIVNTSSGHCWSSQINNPVPGINENAPSSRDYENGFGVSLMYKDLKLANEAAKQAKLNLPMADRAAEIYDEVNRIPELKNKDMSVIYKWLEQH
jgi:3-hydroxyisobutyrate dehydrogenase